MRLLPLLVVALLAASPAEAHLLGGAAPSAFTGFLHPLSGLDHVLAMIVVGLWASQQGRAAALALPLAFPLAMAAGAMLAFAGFVLPAPDAAIALSVLLLGLMIALALRMPLPAGASLVAAFALFHGHAHGAELPASASPLGYGAGFLAATVLLHVIGLGLGRAARLGRGRLVLRAAGSAIAAAGILLMVA